MMRHFCICADISGTRDQGIGHKMWASYLFRNLNGSLGGFTSHKAANKDEIERRIAETWDESYTVEFDEDGFKDGIVFRSFHYQARFFM